MDVRERRKLEGRPSPGLKRELNEDGQVTEKHARFLKQLNEDQRIALADLEKFGWELKFIRRPMFQQPIPVVFDSSRQHYAVLNTDGTLDEDPGFDIRR